MGYEVVVELVVGYVVEIDVEIECCIVVVCVEYDFVMVECG